MFRRRCGAVIDEEYVQEHILTDGIVAPLEAPRRLIHGRSAISVGVVASHPTHLFRSGRFVLLLRVAAAPSNATRSTISTTLLTKRMQQMIDGGLRSV